MQTFFSADYHFHHSNILKYDNRPFKDIDHMNISIIKKHNSRITKNDTIYFLGDFAFYASKERAFRGEGQPYTPDELLSKMNGKFYCIGGNHDKASNKFNPKTVSMVLNQNGIRIQLIHNPKYAGIECDLILCGHVHREWKVKELYYKGQIRLIINVGCPAWDYYPIRLDEVLEIYYRWQRERVKIKKWGYPKILDELNKGFGHNEH